jgi:hypothetical protein
MSVATLTSPAITDSEVKAFAKDWYHKLDIHAPLEEFRALLASEGLEMVFPEVTARGWEGYRDWYERVIRLFFDEVHTVKETKIIRNTGEKAEVKVVVRWEASVWKAPAPRSERIILDAFQTWTVQRSPETQKLVISRYVVDSLQYAEGSAKL